MTIAVICMTTSIYSSTKAKAAGDLGWLFNLNMFLHAFLEQLARESCNVLRVGRLVLITVTDVDRHHVPEFNLCSGHVFTNRGWVFIAQSFIARP